MKLSKKKLNIKNKKKSIKQTGGIFVDIENGKVVNKFKITAKHKTLPASVIPLGQFEKHGHFNTFNIGQNILNKNQKRDFYIYNPNEIIISADNLNTYAISVDENSDINISASPINALSFQSKDVMIQYTEYIKEILKEMYNTLKEDPNLSFEDYKLSSEMSKISIAQQDTMTKAITSFNTRLKENIMTGMETHFNTIKKNIEARKNIEGKLNSLVIFYTEPNSKEIKGYVTITKDKIDNIRYDYQKEELYFIPDQTQPNLNLVLKVGTNEIESIIGILKKFNKVVVFYNVIKERLIEDKDNFKLVSESDLDYVNPFSLTRIGSKEPIFSPIVLYFKIEEDIIKLKYLDLLKKDTSSLQDLVNIKISPTRDRDSNYLQIIKSYQNIYHIKIISSSQESLVNDSNTDITAYTQTSCYDKLKSIINGQIQLICPPITIESSFKSEYDSIKEYLKLDTSWINDALKEQIRSIIEEANSNRAPKTHIGSMIGHTSESSLNKEACLDLKGKMTKTLINSQPKYVYQFINVDGQFKLAYKPLFVTLYDKFDDYYCNFINNNCSGKGGTTRCEGDKYLDFLQQILDLEP